MQVFYLRDKKNFPVSCVVADRDSEGRVYYGLSTYNPIDKFDKREGRFRAHGNLIDQMQHGPKCSVGVSQGPKDYYKVQALVMNAIARTASHPQRAKDSARAWLMADETLNNVELVVRNINPAKRSEQISALNELLRNRQPHSCVPPLHVQNPSKAVDIFNSGEYVSSFGEDDIPKVTPTPSLPVRASTAIGKRIGKIVAGRAKTLKGKSTRASK